jgi:hypothetical protein
VAAEVLRRGVDDDVGAPLQRAEEVRRRDRVVDDERHADLVGDGGDRLDVEDVLLRVGDGLAEERLGVGAGRGAPGLGVVRVLDEADLDAEPGQAVVEEVVRAAVEAGAGHDVVARLGDVEDRQRLRGLAARHEQCADAAFEAREALLHDVVRGVHQAGVDVAELLQPEEGGGVVGVLEDVRRRLVDRQRAGAGDGVRCLAGMDLTGLERPTGAHMDLHGRGTA